MTRCSKACGTRSSGGWALAWANSLRSKSGRFIGPHLVQTAFNQAGLHILLPGHFLQTFPHFEAGTERPNLDQRDGPSGQGSDLLDAPLLDFKQRDHQPGRRRKLVQQPSDQLTGGFRVLTSKGPLEAREVVIATNGYTGDVTPTLKRRLVPVASHIIATEEIAEDLAKSLIPKGRVVSDTKRVLCYYRQSPDNKRVIFGGRARFTQVSPEVSAPVLHGYMLERWPQLKGTKVTHAWTGNVAFAFDFLPHMGMEQGMHYLMACNGSGVAMMSYLGYQTARKIAGGSNAPINAFDGQEFPTVPLYSGNPWFLPMVGAWYRTRDWWDRLTA